MFFFAMQTDESKKGSKHTKGSIERQLTKKKKDGGSSDSQNQVQYKITNTSAPTWFNDAYNQPPMVSY